MPLYEFKCEECGEVRDIIVKFSEADDPQPCEKCEDAPMLRVATISRTGFLWRGRWYKNSQGY